VTYTGVADTFLVASGLVQRAGVTASSNAENGWISLWGPTDGDPVNGSLGTGVVMPLASFRGARKVGEHLLILGAARKDTPLVYYAGAGWTRGGDFASGAEWDAYIDAFARRLRAPLKILIRAAR